MRQRTLIFHIAVPALPFGGVGASGMGAYHGRRASTRSATQGVLFAPVALLDPPALRPPYKPWKMKLTLESSSRRARPDRAQAPVLVAARPLPRMRGLLGRAELPSDQGILLRPASSVHTFFMRFPIDVVFLDRDEVVVGIESSLSPWKTAGRRGAKAVVELAAGECERRGVQVGDRLVAA